MNKLIVTIFLALFLVCQCVQTASAQRVHVRGYVRADGTYVMPHWRTAPDSNPYNNWSYPGNSNPYTFKTATGNSDTYLNRYYSRGPVFQPSPVFVNGYIRRDGTYVSPHWRTR